MWYRYESGVHRVQRVPSTESKGRVHTSTASVVVMPEPTEVDRHINDGDLRIGALLRSGSAPHCAHAACCLAEVFRASGAGGQVIPPVPSLFTLLRPYLAHFPPRFFSFFARFPRLAERF